MEPTTEMAVRGGAFVAVLLAMSAWEVVAPRRELHYSKRGRWLSNLGLVGLNSILARLVTPLSAVAAAVAAAELDWGLLNQFAMPEPVKIAVGVIALDLVLYLQHVLFHAVPALWRLHMVHHADPDFDVTTGVRFHTIEILLSMGIKVAAVAALGPPAVAVIVFEVLLNASSMFNHSNIRMPGWLDRLLRLIVVTPDMHRVHHSTIRQETNSNFGFNLPWWDYVLGTYRAQPAEGHESMHIGLNQILPERSVGLHWLLSLPFLGQSGEYPINREQRSE